MAALRVALRTPARALIRYARGMRFTVCALALLCWSSSAIAQVNAEGLRSTFTDEGVYFQVDGSVGWRQGNVNYLDLSSSINLGYNKDIHTPLLTFNASYSDWDDEPYLSLAFAHARWTAAWHDHVASELFTQAQYNAFLFLRVRALAGAGARLTIFDGKSFEMYAATGYLIEREIFQRSQIPADEPHPIATTNHRMANYLSFTIRADETLSFTNVIYVQPRFDEFSDYRVLEEAALTLTHSSGLNLSFGISMRFDSDPPTVLERLDITLMSKLGIHLSRKRNTSESDS